jgi:hypothetical protein
VLSGKEGENHGATTATTTQHYFYFSLFAVVWCFDVVGVHWPFALCQVRWCSLFGLVWSCLVLFGLVWFFCDL